MGIEAVNRLSYALKTENHISDSHSLGIPVLRVCNAVMENLSVGRPAWLAKCPRSFFP